MSQTVRAQAQARTPNFLIELQPSLTVFDSARLGYTPNPQPLFYGLNFKSEYRAQEGQNIGILRNIYTSELSTY